MNKKNIGVAGGIFIICSMFLPLISLLGISMSMFKSNNSVAIFFILCGMTISGISLLSTRWLNLLSVLLGIIVSALAIKYYGDAGDSEAGVGIGVWVMLAGGLLSLVGGAVGAFAKKQV